MPPGTISTGLWFFKNSFKNNKDFLMTQLIITTRDGQEHTIPGKAGVSVMELIRQASIDELLALCGGCCSCATCHVYVDPAFFGALPPIADEESDVLDGSGYRRETSRLSCQVTFHNAMSGLKVKIAPAD